MVSGKTAATEEIKNTTKYPEISCAASRDQSKNRADNN
jgi:hypothetical protein